MRVLAKTMGWLVVSGTIIFVSNVAGGAYWKTALYGAVIAKIGTTVAYLIYEVAFEKGWKRPVTPAEKV
jgi:uncharacterized membrane protein